MTTEPSLATPDEETDRVIGQNALKRVGSGVLTVGALLFLASLLVLVLQVAVWLQHAEWVPVPTSALVNCPSAADLQAALTPSLSEPMRDKVRAAATVYRFVPSLRSGSIDRKLREPESMKGAWRLAQVSLDYLPLSVFLALVAFGTSWFGLNLVERGGRQEVGEFLRSLDGGHGKGS